MRASYMQGECMAGPAADGAHKHLVQDEHRAWYGRTEGLKSSLGIRDTSRIILQKSQEFLFWNPRGGSLEVCFWGRGGSGISTQSSLLPPGSSWHLPCSGVSFLGPIQSEPQFYTLSLLYLNTLNGADCLNWRYYAIMIVIIKTIII